MNPWLQGGLLTLILIIGFLIGCFCGEATGIRTPNAWIPTVVLLIGSLGRPSMTCHLLGQNMVSFVVALCIAGFMTGIAFWPMGQRQGEKEWL